MGTSIVPNLDSIDSFRVLTSNFDAEYGNSSGGQVLVTTKSGTAQVHGSAFEFLRNTELDARNYFSQDRAAYQQNQFGGTLGGEPLHKSVMLFGDYQGTRLTEGIDTGEHCGAVYSGAKRRLQPESADGKCEWQLLGSAVVVAPWSDGYSGRAVCSVFPDGKIPQSAWSVPANNLLASIPEPKRGAGCLQRQRRPRR